jgi:hypothetical protein
MMARPGAPRRGRLDRLAARSCRDPSRSRTRSARPAWPRSGVGVGRRHPRAGVAPLLVGSAGDEQTSSHQSANRPRQRMASWTTTGAPAASAAVSAASILGRTAGEVIASSRRRSAGSPKTRAARADRSSAPSGPRTSGPKAATTAARAGSPGSSTARARTSASTTAAPRAASQRATVDFPQPIGPVSPIRSTRRPAAPLTGLAPRARARPPRPPPARRRRRQVRSSRVAARRSWPGRRVAERQLEVVRRRPSQVSSASTARPGGGTRPSGFGRAGVARAARDRARMSRRRLPPTS